MKLAPLLAGLVSASILAAPLAASAQPAPPLARKGAAPDKKGAAPDKKGAAPDEGREHFTRGVALFREGDYRAALVEFRRAYEISHNYRALYNIAQTEFEVQDYAGARSSFQKYLAEGGAEIEAGRRAEVEADIKKLALRVARVEIKTNTEGADVLVDDVVIGQAPLKEPLLVSAGRRKITLQKGALPPVTRFVDLAGGDASSVTINLAAAEPPARAVAAPAPALALAPMPPPAPSRTALWVSLAGTGALTAGAVVTGILALGAHSDAETKLGTFGVKAADIDAARSKVTTLALVTDVLGGAAIVMGGVSIVLAATSGKARASEAKPAAALLLSPRGAVLTGQF